MHAKNQDDFNKFASVELPSASKGREISILFCKRPFWEQPTRFYMAFLLIPHRSPLEVIVAFGTSPPIPWDLPSTHELQIQGFCCSCWLTRSEHKQKHEQGGKDYLLRMEVRGILFGIVRLG